MCKVANHQGARIMKLVVFNETDPGSAITFEYTPPKTPGHTRGWHGLCTTCGQAMHYWTDTAAFKAGQAHVNTCHEEEG